MIFAVALIALLSRFPGISSDQGDLYQSDFTAGVDDWNSHFKKGRGIKGWYYNRNDRVYSTCDVMDIGDASNLENELVREFQKKATQPLRLDVEVSTQVKSCESSNGANGCKESFNIELRYVDKSMKPQSTSRKVEELANMFQMDVPEGVSKYSLRFVDNGVCANITSLRISYMFCPAQVQNLINYRETFSSSLIVRAYMQCIENAVSTERFPVFCYPTGYWAERKAEYCKCKPGYQPDEAKTECRSCRPSFYKSKSGNEACRQCPHNSNTRHSGSTECQCDPGHARAQTENPDLHCYPQPDKPRSLEFRTLNYNQIVLQWSPPHKGKHDLSKVWYELQCQAPSGNCSRDPAIHTEDTSTILKYLKDDQTYLWRVCAKNDVSIFLDSNSDSNCDTVQFHTPKIMKVGSLKIRTVAGEEGESYLVLEWKEPSTNMLGLLYRVQIIPPDEKTIEKTVNGSRNCMGQVCRYQISTHRLSPGTYQFRVGLGNPVVFSAPLHVPIENNINFTNHVRQLLFTVGLLFAVLLLILVASTSVFCCCRRKIDQRLMVKIPPHGGPAGAYYTLPGHYNTVTQPNPNDFPMKGGGGSFVEPVFHPDVEALLAKHARELDDHRVSSSYHQLKGHFADLVEFGTLAEDGYSSVLVPVSLHHYIPVGQSDSSTTSSTLVDHSQRDLVVAAATCAQLIHPNVLSLRGFIKREDHSITMVTEHAELGTLQLLLQDGHVSNTSQLIHMARGIACGMRYLQEEGYVHKVLMSGNVLVSQNLVCKIAGFSHRSKLDACDKSNENFIPDDLLPWTPPEVLLYGQYSWAADVWSFGVVLWEMMSQGLHPFYSQGIQPFQITRYLESGYRLPQPADCPLQIYELMSVCWIGDCNKRPRFVYVVETLENLMKNPMDTSQVHGFDKTWNDTMRYSTARRFGTLNTPKFRPPISQWLAEMDLLDYDMLFQMSGLHSLDDLTRLTNEDLKAIGVDSSRDRKKLLLSIHQMYHHHSYSMELASYSCSSTDTYRSPTLTRLTTSMGPREQLMSQYV